MDDDQTETVLLSKTASQAEPMPPTGGSFVRERDGALKPIAGTKPAPERAHSEPGFLPAAGQTESE